jgi:hypothetical protein
MAKWRGSMVPRFTAPLAALGRLVALALACGAAPASTACHHEPDEMDDPDLPVVATNPDGLAYPTDHLGGQKRVHTRAGDRIPNLTFRAYRNGRAGGLETVSLAEYYDPAQKRNKLLDVQIAATWCAICSAEVDATVSVKDLMKEKGAVFVEVLVSGATASKGPSLLEVDDWVDSHKTNFPTGIDVRARRLGALGVSADVVPYDILVDTRTMEILDSSAGAPRNVVDYFTPAFEWLAENPPSY